MDKIPTLQEWQAANPGKPINEYFITYGAKAQEVPQYFLQAVPAPIVPVQKESREVAWVGILGNGLALAAYMMPLATLRVIGKFDLGQLDMSELPALLDMAVNPDENAISSQQEFWSATVMMFIILPIVGMGSCLARLDTLRFVSGCIYALIAGAWIYYLYGISNHVETQASEAFFGLEVGKVQYEAGYFLMVAAAIALFGDACNFLLKQEK